LLELLIVVRNEHAQEEHAEAVEEQDPVEGELDRARDSLTRVLRLANRYTNEFSACTMLGTISTRVHRTNLPRYANTALMKELQKP
jgi:hypothetical protein